MLVLDPLKRISMKEALNHSYFDDLRPEVKTIYNKCMTP